MDLFTNGPFEMVDQIESNLTLTTSTTALECPWVKIVAPSGINFFASFAAFDRQVFIIFMHSLPLKIQLRNTITLNNYVIKLRTYPGNLPIYKGLFDFVDI